MENEFTPSTEYIPEPPAPSCDEEQRKLFRRIGSRIGFGMLAYMAVVLFFSSVVEGIVYAFWPELYANTVFLLTVSDLCTYGLGPLVLWLVIRKLPCADLRQRSITPLRFGKLALEAVGLMYAVSMLSSQLISLIQNLTGRGGSLLDEVTSNMPMWAIFLFMVVIAPPLEELIFRGLLYRRLQPLGTAVAVVVDGLMFGLFHTNLEQFFYAVALGIFFSLIVAKTGRLRYSIALHMLLNFLGSVVVSALTPYETAIIVFSYIIYVLMALGILLLILDRKSLAPAEPAAPGEWKAVFVNPGMLACIIILLGIAAVVLLAVY